MDSTPLFNAILSARERVYCAGSPTPLQAFPLPSIPADIWVKREDLGPIKSYKWRGSYNAIASLKQSDSQKIIVAASAGNHAQGVALASRILGRKAHIFMPLSTPQVKQDEVLRHGGDSASIQLIGDSYDEACDYAKSFAKKENAVFIHPYDDLAVMGGQGTLADEVVMSGKGPFHRVYVPIGGGGLAGATACWLKRYWPTCKVYGVESHQQASMRAAFEVGHPINLEYLDVFCDGTAVRKVGDTTFSYCKNLLEGLITVDNDAVCHAMRLFWEVLRIIPEPSGALALAGLLEHHKSVPFTKGEKSLAIVSGANMDFAQLGAIAKRAGIGEQVCYYLRIAIPEGRGNLVDFLDTLPANMSITDLQYGRTDSDIQFPVLGITGSKAAHQSLCEKLDAHHILYSDVTGEEDIDYRIIPYVPSLFAHPLIVQIEFSERAGALRQFMKKIRDLASLCYFNYSYSGERVGRALLGMDFSSQETRKEALDRINELAKDRSGGIRALRQVSKNAFERLTNYTL